MARTTGLVVASVRRTIGTGNRPADLELEDIVQAIYLKLIRNDCRLLRTFDPGRASMSTWLTLVARSTAIDTLRRLKPLTTEVEDSTSAVPYKPVSEPDVHIPVHILTGRQRLVLTLLFDDERSVPEAAEILGVNQQTIRSTKHKALERLRAHFDASDASEPSGGDET